MRASFESYYLIPVECQLIWLKCCLRGCSRRTQRGSDSFQIGRWLEFGQAVRVADRRTAARERRGGRAGLRPVRQIGRHGLRGGW